jgi:hypothetical protein
MKAEHRKQLQTNALADRMGRLVQTLKQRPQKRTVLYVVIGLALLLGLFIFLRYRAAQAAERSQLWVFLDNGHQVYIDELWKNRGDSNAGRAAQFQYAWYTTWENGIKALAADHGRALFNLEKVAKPMYRKLAEACKDDPIWEPEAYYVLAVIEETFAVMDRKHLDKAREQYDIVASKFKTSAAGIRAEKRAELLKPNTRSRDEINNFYFEFQRDLNIPATIPKLN